MSNFATRSVKDEIMEASYDRPAGVSILAVLLFIGGVITLGTQLLAFCSPPNYMAGNSHVFAKRFGGAKPNISTTIA